MGDIALPVDAIKAAVSELNANRRLFPIIVSLSRSPKSIKEIQMEMEERGGRAESVRSCVDRLMKMGLVGKRGARYMLVAIDPRLLVAALADGTALKAEQQASVPVIPLRAKERMVAPPSSVPASSLKIAERFKVPAERSEGVASLGAAARCSCGAVTPLRYGSTSICYKCARGEGR